MLSKDDLEDQRQLLPDESDAAAATAAAAKEDSIANVLASSTLQDPDASAQREKSPPASLAIACDDYDAQPSFGGSDEERSFDDVEEDIKRIYSDAEDTAFTLSTSERDFAERTLPEDTFSFLIYSDVFSWSFICGMMVFLFQISIYIILGMNIIDIEKKKNPVGFPIDVVTEVRISEAIAIFISIIAQHDVRRAICLYRDGFDKGGITQVFKGATLSKWTLSIVLRASEGLLGLSITFLLIMRSSSVLDLLLNFSAIEFVTMLGKKLLLVSIFIKLLLTETSCLTF